MSAMVSFFPDPGSQPPISTAAASRIRRMSPPRTKNRNDRNNPNDVQESADASYDGAMDSVGPPEIMRILAVTDALGYHREAVVVPLWTKGKGEILVRGQKL